MILHLVAPPVPLAIESMRVVRWHASEGSETTFGVLVVELATAVGRKRGRGWRPTATERRAAANPDEHRDPSKGELVQITASERAFLRRIVAQPSDHVRTGDLLAVFTSTPDEQVGDTAPESALQLRSVTDVVSWWAEPSWGEP
ncbi:MAG: hypothetical protein QOI95_3270 [Acidimicrobiaceae bacterium]|jgi:hypothetical protein